MLQMFIYCAHLATYAGHMQKYWHLLNFSGVFCIFCIVLWVDLPHQYAYTYAFAHAQCQVWFHFKDEGACSEAHPGFCLESKPETYKFCPASPTPTFTNDKRPIFGPRFSLVILYDSAKFYANEGPSPTTPPQGPPLVGSQLVELHNSCPIWMWIIWNSS